jgi:hypothetical protein
LRMSRVMCSALMVFTATSVPFHRPLCTSPYPVDYCTRHATQ